MLRDYDAIYRVNHSGLVIYKGASSPSNSGSTAPESTRHGTFAINSDSARSAGTHRFEFAGSRARQWRAPTASTAPACMHCPGDTDDGAAIVGRIDTDTCRPPVKVSRIDRVTLSFDGGGSVVVHAVRASKAAPDALPAARR